MASAASSTCWEQVGGFLRGYFSPYPFNIPACQMGPHGSVPANSLAEVQTAQWRAIRPRKGYTFCANPAPPQGPDLPTIPLTPAQKHSLLASVSPFHHPTTLVTSLIPACGWSSWCSVIGWVGECRIGLSTSTVLGATNIVYRIFATPSASAAAAVPAKDKVRTFALIKGTILTFQH